MLSIFRIVALLAIRWRYYAATFRGAAFRHEHLQEMSLRWLHHLELTRHKRAAANDLGSQRPQISL
jgi:hypothetical protein